MQHQTLGGDLRERADPGRRVMGPQEAAPLRTRQGTSYFNSELNVLAHAHRQLHPHPFRREALQ